MMDTAAEGDKTKQVMAHVLYDSIVPSLQTTLCSMHIWIIIGARGVGSDLIAWGRGVRAHYTVVRVCICMYACVYTYYTRTNYGVFMYSVYRFGTRKHHRETYFISLHTYQGIHCIFAPNLPAPRLASIYNYIV